jgi:hypothetical protein
LKTYCDLFDEKYQKGKRKPPVDKSFISLKPVHDFFKPTAKKEDNNEQVEAPLAT